VVLPGSQRRPAPRAHSPYFEADSGAGSQETRHDAHRHPSFFALALAAGAVQAQALPGGNVVGGGGATISSGGDKARMFCVQPR
jgi:hypothetical protein